MRLLHRGSDGNWTLTKNMHTDIPAYAILSYTWGKDEDEVTLRDMQNNTAQNKPGYRKIKFCGEQAARDGLQYFWVDSCCIYSCLPWVLDRQNWGRRPPEWQAYLPCLYAHVSSFSI
jgi:hypothetical protein